MLKCAKASWYMNFSMGLITTTSCITEPKKHICNNAINIYHNTINNGIASLFTFKEKNSFSMVVLNDQVIQ